MKVGFFGFNNKSTFSGGRYHALLLSYSLSFLKDFQVKYFSNAFPVFFKDVVTVKNKNFEFFVTDLKALEEDFELDYLVVVPNGHFDDDFYRSAKKFAHINKACLILLNFEDGHWFNQNSVSKRDIRIWDGWRYIIEDGGIILSSSRFSLNKAKEFYGAEKKLNMNFVILLLIPSS